MNVPSVGKFEESYYASQAAHSESSESDQMCPDQETVDYWRHERMFAPIRSLVESDPSATWLTVGDGRYGSDARRLISWRANATASDISDSKLQQAHDAGLLPYFRKENAEAMNCTDNSYDYVLCKEAYHHFPRPAVALYEMLRVSRRGVVLIEPNDQFSPQGIGQFAFTKARELVVRLCGHRSARDEFEESGNYVYRLSVREVEKIATAINLPTIAVHYMNDYYMPAGRNICVGTGSSVERRTKLMIALHDLAARLHLKPYRVIIAVIFRSSPPSELTHRLKKAGFILKNLPRNPYLKPEPSE